MIIYGLEEDIDFEVYNTALAVRRWVLRENDEPDGMCYDARLELVQRLAKKDIPSNMVQGCFRLGLNWCVRCQHWWVTLGPWRKKMVLDVTGDQFNDELIKIDQAQMKPIVFGHIDQFHGYYAVDRDDTCSCEECHLDWEM
jgi:hypothetical protein